ncbi:hypothetical protein ABPG72_021127 [Tetrahymena utriculariae]
MNFNQNSDIMNSGSVKKDMQKVKKINGFTQKINIQQISSYLILACLFFVFTFCILPTLSLAVQIISGILYYASFVIMFILGFICTDFDPTDQNVIKEKTSRLNKIDYDVSALDFYCINCSTHVSSNSKHCKACNRCVENFDHHCKWLNNCVGQVNYSLFFKLITTVLIHVIIFTVFACISLFMYYFTNDNDNSISQELFFLFSNDSSLTVNIFQILLWIFVIVGILVAFFDGNLVFFHIYLQKKNLSTYQYILSSREKKQMEEYRKKELLQQRQKEKEDQKKLKEEKKQKDQINSNNNLPIQQTQGNNLQKNLQSANPKQVTQSSYIYTPQYNNNTNNNNSINFQNQNQNININEDKNLNAAVSRQDSMETHSQRTNPFEFADQKKGFTPKGNSINSQFSQKKLNKSGFWAQICCCFKSQKNEAKIGAIGLTKIDEQSEFMEEKEDQKNNNFAIIDEMNQRGICQTVDIMDDIQKMKNQYSNRQMQFEIDNNELYLNKATQILQNNTKIVNKSININDNAQNNQIQYQITKLQLERVATEELSLKQLPHEGGNKSNHDFENNSNRSTTNNNKKKNFQFDKKVNQNKAKSGLDIVSVNLTQKSDSPGKQSNTDKNNKNSIDSLTQKKQHLPPKILYLRSTSKSSLKSNQQSSNGEVHEIKTEDKHNSIPPSQIQIQNIINMQPIQIKQNSTSTNEINK